MNPDTAFEPLDDETEAAEPEEQGESIPLTDFHRLHRKIDALVERLTTAHEESDRVTRENVDLKERLNLLQMEVARLRQAVGEPSEVDYTRELTLWLQAGNQLAYTALNVVSDVRMWQAGRIPAEGQKRALKAARAVERWIAINPSGKSGIR